jgi:hypothetical protein
MHDKHGREIGVGDIVVAHSWPHGRIAPQRVVACNPGATSCNVMLDHGVHGAQISSSNAHDCVLAVKADGTIVKQPE